MENATIPDDTRCEHCDIEPSLYTCDGCGVGAMLVDCGHQRQPRPIAADGHRCYCDDCYAEKTEA